jgi:hypothetical protein
MEEGSEDDRESEGNDDDDEFNPPEEEEQLIDLDAVALHGGEEADLIDFNSPATLDQATTVDKEPNDVNTDGGQGQPPEEVTTLPPPLTPSQTTLPAVGKQVVNEEARTRRATRLPDRYHDVILGNASGAFEQKKLLLILY